MDRTKLNFVAAAIVLVLCSANAKAVIVDLATSLDPAFDPDGLSAQANFTLISPTILTIELTNTSTGVPTGFDNSDQILTGLSFDLGGPTITAGTVIIGPGSRSINFSEISTQLGPDDDVSCEWGYGNIGSTNMMLNMVSTNTSHMTRFDESDNNLDGPYNIDGPRSGLVALDTDDLPLIDIGGLGAIGDSIIITLTLSDGLTNYDFLDNGIIAEFGSDAAFLVPEPATIILLGLGTMVLLRKRKA
jgi:hypothetical protein